MGAWQARGRRGARLMAGAMCSKAGPLEGRRAALLLVRAGAARVIRGLCMADLLRTSTLLHVRCGSFSGGSLDTRLQLSLGRAESRRLRVREELGAQPKPVPAKRSMRECTHTNRRCVGPAHTWPVARRRDPMRLTAQARRQACPATHGPASSTRRTGPCSRGLWGGRLWGGRRGRRPFSTRKRLPRPNSAASGD